MRLILVTASLGAGGAERVLSDMANFWAEQGWEITFATWSGPETDDFYSLDDRVRRVWLNVDTNTRGLFGQLRSHWRRISLLRRLIRSVRPAALVSFLDWSNVLAILASQGTGVRTVISERISPPHNATLGRSWRLARRLVYRFADCVVGQTDDVTQWLIRRCRARATTVPNPLRRLPPPGDDADRSQTVLAVGRLSAQKGFDTLLRAYAQLGPIAASWRLRIIGAGPQLEALQQLAEGLNIADSVTFDAPIKNVAEEMSKASIFALASRFEGFPNALVEAMAMGMAVVSTDCPAGPSTIIDDKVSGLLVPVDNPRRFAAALAELMANDDDRRRLATAAQTVRSTYEQSRIMRLWESIVVDPSSAGGR